MDRIIDIKSHDDRNDLLKDLQGDIRRMTRGKLGREPTEEEFSIALVATNEAIDLYDQKRNASFLTFAGKMIFHRLMDFFRKKKKEKEIVPYDNENIALFSEWKAIDEYQTRQFSEDLGDELEQAEEILARLGYTWTDIIKNKPKHRDSLERLLHIAFRIVSLRVGDQFLRFDPFPSDLRKLVGVDRRILKKYRPYLCALIIAYIYDLPIIKSYLERRRRNGNT